MRFGRVRSYDEWIKPRVVGNAVELLRDAPRYRHKIKFVHLCFTTDPFMYCYQEIEVLSMKLIAMLKDAHIKCTLLTKGCLPLALVQFLPLNECGVSLMSLDEDFRNKTEPFSAPYGERIGRFFQLHKRGVKTWVGIEQYPTLNILFNQASRKIIEFCKERNKEFFIKEGTITSQESAAETR